jgi:competence protein ComEA
MRFVGAVVRGRQRVGCSVIRGLLTRREQAVLIFFAASIVAGSSFLWWERRDMRGITVTHDSETMPVSPAGESSGMGEEGVSESATTPPAAIGIIPAAIQDAFSAEVTTEHIIVSVAGAVNKPDVYRLPGGSVVEDAVEAAGGYAENADPTAINRAAKLIDGTTLTVPAQRSMYVEGDSGPGLRIVSPATNIPAYMPGFVAQSAGERSVPGAVGAVGSGKININTASREELQALPRIGPKLADAIVEYRSKHPFRSIEELQSVPRIGPKTFEGLKELITVGKGER